VRPVNRLEQRISEADKLGYDKIIVSKYNKDINSKKHKIEIVLCSKIEDVVLNVFS
jgi:DNA repair protein RadA/Sms